MQNRHMRFRQRKGMRASTGIMRSAPGRGIGRGVMGVAAPAIVALIQDLRQKDGYIRPFFRRMLAGRSSRNKVITVKGYELIEDRKENDENNKTK